jgi:hypothetical protein
MPLKTRDLKQALTGKFHFAPAKSKGQDHEWFQLTLEGYPKILTKVSRGMHEISDSLLPKIANQLMVPRSFLVGMVQCSNSREDYYARIRANPTGPHAARFRRQS